mgnify:CR=1 FL=1
MDVVAIVKISAKEGKSLDALKVIKKSQEHCLSLDFCGGFDIFQCQKNVHLFQFVERWTSVEKHKAFLASLMNDPSFIESLDVFTSGPSIEYYTVK